MASIVGCLNSLSSLPGYSLSCSDNGRAARVFFNFGGVGKMIVLWYTAANLTGWMAPASLASACKHRRGSCL